MRAAAGMTGLKPDGAGWKTVGTVPLEAAREMMGVVGTGKATLKRGSGSATPVAKLAGGERLSGDALGGVSGAYGMETAGTLGMLTTETGVCSGGAAATLDKLFTWELAAKAALMASSFWERRFSRWPMILLLMGSFASTPSMLER